MGSNFAEAKGITVKAKVCYDKDWFNHQGGYDCKLVTADNYYGDEIFTLRILNDTYPRGFQNRGQMLSVVASRHGYTRGTDEGILLFKGNYNECKRFIKNSCKVS